MSDSSNQRLRRMIEATLKREGEIFPARHKALLVMAREEGMDKAGLDALIEEVIAQQERRWIKPAMIAGACVALLLAVYGAKVVMDSRRRAAAVAAEAGVRVEAERLVDSGRAHEKAGCWLEAEDDYRKVLETAGKLSAPGMIVADARDGIARMEPKTVELQAKRIARQEVERCAREASDRQAKMEAMQGNELKQARAIPKPTGLTPAQKLEVEELDRRIAEQRSHYQRSGQRADEEAEAHNFSVANIELKRVGDAMRKGFELRLQRAVLCLTARDAGETVRSCRQIVDDHNALTEGPPISTTVDLAFDALRRIDARENIFTDSACVDSLVSERTWMAKQLNLVEELLPLKKSLLESYENSRAMGSASAVDVESVRQNLEEFRILRCRCLSRLAQIDLLLDGSRDEATRKLILIKTAEHAGSCPYEGEAAKALQEMK